MKALFFETHGNLDVIQLGSHQDFRDVVALLRDGRLTPVIDRIMPLSEGKAAYAVMERGDMFGKIVLTP
jgi:NADPH:quinone reductase-like Zn-dependent oxidoreductase